MGPTAGRPRLPDCPNEQRIAMLRPDELDARQQELLDAMMSGKRGASAANGGPFGVWLHNPDFGMQVQRFGEYIRYDTNLDAAVSELLILACAVHWRAQYEWFVHAPIARSSGVPAPLVEALRTGAALPEEYGPQCDLVRFAQSLLKTGFVSDEIFASLSKQYSAAQIIEMVGVLGYYSLVAMTLNLFQVAVPDRDFVGME